MPFSPPQEALAQGLTTWSLKEGSLVRQTGVLCLLCSPVAWMHLLIFFFALSLLGASLCQLWWTNSFLFFQQNCLSFLPLLLLARELLLQKKSKSSFQN